MKNEIEQVKGTRIYCIYFENERYNFSEESPTTTLQKISELGGTGIYKTSKDLSTLITAFTEISNSIEINFKLAFSKKNN